MENKKIHIKLQELKPVNSFKVPDQYFENLPADIMSKINSSPQKVKKQGYLYPAVLSLAACVLLLLAVFVFDNQPANDMYSAQDDHLEYLLSDDVQDYLAMKIDRTLIIEAFLSADDITLDDNIRIDEDKADIEEYLLDNWSYLW